ncbi:hypothetical protein SporoP17a_04665 [Sporosarcina ureae]|nr:hypothetical protein SporoP17a_04665 [Sporosarcina ureae]
MKACGIRSCLMGILVSNMRPTTNTINRIMANSKGGRVEVTLDIHRQINTIRNGPQVIRVTSRGIRVTTQDIHSNIIPGIQITLTNPVTQGIQDIQDAIHSMETTAITRSIMTDIQEVNRSKVHRLPLLQAKYRAIQMLNYAQWIPAA